MTARKTTKKVVAPKMRTVYICFDKYQLEDLTYESAAMTDVFADAKLHEFYIKLQVPNDMPSTAKELATVTLG